MAQNVFFKKGLLANLPASYAAGTFYVTTDERAMYLDIDDSTRIRLGDFIQVDAVANLPTDGASTTALYYCVAENILAKWNGSTWTQINKQPTAEEMKTLLGLGTLAYKSEVAEADLNADLAAKINDSTEANHGHENKDVIDGITAEKVAAWDAAESNAKGHADGLNTAMNTRVEALETAIGENGSVATQIKTAIEALDFTDTAVDGEYVSAVNEVDGKISVTRKALPDYSNTYDAKGAAATALDNAKAYADGLAANYDEKGAAAGVQATLEAEIAKKVDKVEGKSLIADTEIARLATLANYDDTQVKADIAKKADAETMTTELGKKVDKVEGYSLVSDTEIARLANVDNYDDTALAGRVTTAEGKITALETESAKHALKTELEAVDAKFADYNTTVAQKAIDDAQDARIKAIEDDYVVANDIANFETKENVKKVADDLAAYVESNDAAVADRYTKAEADGKFALKGADAYDDTEVRGLISDNAGAIAAEAERAAGIEAGLRTDVDAIKGDHLKGADKTELEGKITAEETRAKGVEESLQTQINTIMNNPDAEGAINSINEFTKYVEDHGTIADGFRTDIDKNKEDIAANASAIADNAAAITGIKNGTNVNDFAAAETIMSDLGQSFMTIAGNITKDYMAADEALDGRIATLEAIDHNAYVDADAALKSELEGTIADGDATTLEAAKADAANKDVVVLAEAQKYADQAKVDAIAAADGKVNALAGNVYTKAQTYTQAEVDALIQQAQTWGEF